MTHAKKITALIVVFAVAAIAAAIGYWWAKRDAHTDRGSAAAVSAQRRVLYWYDPMMPGQHFDKPGKSPFMDMQLVPKYADETAGNDNAGIRVSPTLQQNLGIRWAPVERRVLDTRVDAVGTVGFNERALAVVQARTAGFVGRVYARAPGDVIERGAPLVDIVVPEWAAAQQEYLALRSSDDKVLADAARDRLGALGMPADLIRRIEQSGLSQTSVTVAAPIGGVIQTLDVRSGMTVAPGMTLAQINALDTVWLSAAIPEALGAGIAIGDRLVAQLPALAGGQREGRVIAVLPQTDAASRTLTVRIELPNPRGELRPGQYARVQVHDDVTTPVLTVPASALIRSGTRTLVIVASDDRFVPTAVQTGREIDGFVEIRSGLKAGQQVVVSGQFLIDSEANLSGVLQQMTDDEHSGGAQ